MNMTTTFTIEIHDNFVKQIVWMHIIPLTKISHSCLECLTLYQTQHVNVRDDNEWSEIPSELVSDGHAPSLRTTDVDVLCLVFGVLFWL